MQNSISWNSWQKNLEQTLKGGDIFGSEQLAMNMSVYIDEIETEFNWQKLIFNQTKFYF